MFTFNEESTTDEDIRAKKVSASEADSDVREYSMLEEALTSLVPGPSNQDAFVAILQAMREAAAGASSQGGTPPGERTQEAHPTLTSTGRRDGRGLSGRR